jgi:hypothetical protein
MQLDIVYLWIVESVRSVSITEVVAIRKGVLV